MSPTIGTIAERRVATRRARAAALQRQRRHALRYTAVEHPAREYIRSIGLSVEKLAAAIGYSTNHTRKVLLGAELASPAFRAKVAEALQRPESRLFLPYRSRPRGRPKAPSQ